jgi:hypothetical protein
MSVMPGAGRVLMRWALSLLVFVVAAVGMLISLVFFLFGPFAGDQFLLAILMIGGISLISLLFIALVGR